MRPPNHVRMSSSHHKVNDIRHKHASTEFQGQRKNERPKTWERGLDLVSSPPLLRLLFQKFRDKYSSNLDKPYLSSYLAH